MCVTPKNNVQNKRYDMRLFINVSILKINDKFAVVSDLLLIVLPSTSITLKFIFASNKHWIRIKKQPKKINPWRPCKPAIPIE